MIVEDDFKLVCPRCGTTSSEVGQRECERCKFSLYEIAASLDGARWKSLTAFRRTYNMQEEFAIQIVRGGGIPTRKSGDEMFVDMRSLRALISRLFRDDGPVECWLCQMKVANSEDLELHLNFHQRLLIDTEAAARDLHFSGFGLDGIEEELGIPQEYAANIIERVALQRECIIEGHDPMFDYSFSLEEASIILRQPMSNVAKAAMAEFAVMACGEIDGWWLEWMLTNEEG